MLRLLLCKDVVFGMVYYKVPPSLQDTPCYRPNVSPRIPNGYYLIANELLTLSECRHINAPIEKLEKVTMKKRTPITCLAPVLHVTIKKGA